MSDSLATAAAAPVQGYPVYTMDVLASAQASMPGGTWLERSTCSMFDVVDFMKSPIGMQFYEKFAGKKLPINPIDAMNIMCELQVRFLEQGRPKKDNLAENQPKDGSIGAVAQP